MRRLFLLLVLAPVVGANGLEGQVDQGGARLLSSQGLPAEHVALLMSDQEGGDLVFEQVVSVIPFADGSAGVGMWLEIDADGLLTDTVPERLFLKLTVYVLRDSAIAHSISRAVEITGPQRLLEIDGVRIQGGLALDPGQYRLRALISEPDSGRVGIRENAVEVPRDKARAVSALDLASVNAEWLEVKLDGPALPAGFAPSALAVMPAGTTWSGSVLVRGSEDLALENGSAQGPDAVHAQAWRFEPGPPGWRLARATIDADASLRGRFEIAPVAITEGETRRQNIGADFSVQQQTGADFLRGGVTEVLVTSQVAEAASWTRVRSSSGTPAVVPAPSGSGSGRRLTISKSKARERLLATLAEYAAGDPVAASRLAELEVEAMGGSAGALVTLAELELRTFGSIQQRSPEAVIPVLSLYLHRYADHFERREYFLSTHCKRVAVALAEQASGDPGLRPVLADFMTAMGARQVVANDPNGETALRSALEMQPGHAEALEVLAWHLERTAQYDELIAAVDEAADPPPVTVLRRTLAGIRLGRSDSFPKLEVLAQRDDWVGELAAQELVRAYAAIGHVEAAEQFARTAQERFPNNRKIALLSALMHDLEGRPVESLATMAGIQAEGEVSERHRYSRDPDEVLIKLRRRLDERAADNLDALQQVLKALT